jgi:hypothetical protein
MLPKVYYKKGCLRDRLTNLRTQNQEAMMMNVCGIVWLVDVWILAVLASTVCVVFGIRNMHASCQTPLAPWLATSGMWQFCYWILFNLPFIHVWPAEYDQTRLVPVNPVRVSCQMVVNLVHVQISTILLIMGMCWFYALDEAECSNELYQVSSAVVVFHYVIAGIVVYLLCKAICKHVC